VWGFDGGRCMFMSLNFDTTFDFRFDTLPSESEVKVK